MQNKVNVAPQSLPQDFALDAALNRLKCSRKKASAEFRRTIAIKPPKPLKGRLAG